MPPSSPGTAVSSSALPTHRYLHALPALASGERVTGPSRVLNLAGRLGVQATSIHTAICLGGHPFKSPRGTVVQWFFALEDLACSVIFDHMRIDNPHFANYPFLSDCATPRDYGASHFFFGWFRFNELRAQFYRGMNHWEGLNAPQKAWVQAVPFNEFRQHRWYQVAFTWDDGAEEMRLSVNGILVGTNDRFHREYHREECGPELFTGHPALCHGEVSLYDQVLTDAEIYAAYWAGAPDFDAAEETRLRHRFAGEALADFSFTPGPNWVPQLDLSLREPEHLGHFYLQGQSAGVRVEPEGLRVKTPPVRFIKENTEQQVYLWSEATFEGNIYVEFEWLSHAPAGLGLLMVHASGMAREDFMADYPRKTTGKMTTVHGENVRNYHWEFYREMHDVRNDVGTAFSRKNPFAFRNGFGAAPAPFKLGVWHRLQYLQQGGCLRGAIDGKVLLEIDDSSWTNSGCILNYGHLGLRCMLNTDMQLRNLKVFTEKLPFQVVFN